MAAIPESTTESKESESDSPNGKAPQLSINGRALFDRFKPEPRLRARPSVQKLFSWLLFGVIFGLFPVIADTLRGLTAAKGFDFGSSLARGELFIVSAVLSAGAVGELIVALFSSKHRQFDFLAVGAAFLCVLSVFANTVAYMIVGSITESLAVRLSLWFFGSSVISSAICITKAGRE